MKKNYIIIGNSAAGVAAMRTLRKYDKDAHIICFSAEIEPPYNKCFLADYLGKEKTQEQTYTLTLEQAKQLNIDLRLGTRIVDIASDNKSVMLQDGTHESYDDLLIATGASPVWPNIDQIQNFSNVFAFHSLGHAQKLYSFIEQNKPKKAVVVGSGLSGLEAADALCAHNIDVTVIEKGDQLLSRHVSAAGSALIEQLMRKQGIDVYKNNTVAAVSGKNERLDAVALDNGTTLSADLLVVAIGVKQNMELADKANIKVNMHGIEVNQYLQTSDPHIYAAGDVIATIDQISGDQLASCTWPDAMQQGMYAAMAITGNNKPYRGALIISSSAFFGTKFFNCGPNEANWRDFEVVERKNNDYYHRYILKDGVLKGFCLIGNTQQYPKLRRALLAKQPFTL